MQAKTLDEYFERYGSLLGQQAIKAMKPLHIPNGNQEAIGLMRELFDAQRHVVSGGVKALKRQKSLMIVAEMGTGKTIMAMATIHAHAQPKGKQYRALVFCPGQLVGKWNREIEETIPDVQVSIIDHWSDLAGLRRRLSNNWDVPQSSRRWPCPRGPEWHVIARDRAKLGSRWRPAWVRRAQMQETGLRCPKCGELQRDKAGVLLEPAELSRKQSKCGACGESLWQFTSELARWEPARYIHKHMKGFFDYLVIDEFHEEKSSDSAQGNAVGSLAAACNKVVALTGTLIGGYAEHIRPLLFRLSPRSLVREGFGWKDSTAFNERYGRVEVKTTVRDGGRYEGDDNANSRGKRSSKTKNIRPGIMPTLFGRHLLGNSVFLSLDEVADNLPPMTEAIEAVQMAPYQEEEYRRIEQAMTSTIRDMLRKGNRRFLGAMLQTLLSWPDYPFGWGQVGYWERTPSGDKTFVPVVFPANLPASEVYPKEERLLELLQAERWSGRQSWVFVQYTQERDVCQRLADLCGNRGLRAKILRSSVAPAKREQWIAKNSHGVDVMISHPKLVETGLDLFCKNGGHNFPSLCFYETGYNLFTLRQASRRAWRIGQNERCRVTYLYYAGTMQERAMSMMGDKLVAAQALEGKFSSDGLAILSGDACSAEMELAKSLSDQIDVGHADRHWRRVVSTVQQTMGSEFTDEQAAFLGDILAGLPEVHATPG